MKKKVAVALSGGVDSAVCALLLKQQNYDVVGVTGQMVDGAESIIQNAKNVAQKINIPIYIVDVRKEFEQHVVDYFETSYKSGETPNPCTICNRDIKWGKLLDYSIKKLNVDYMATGHYAEIKFENGIYKLYPAKDTEKDQVYFLFNLNQYQLSKTLFPLAKYTKPEIRQLAEKYNLPPKSAKESQDICFIPKNMSLKKYLFNKFEPRKGQFIDITTGKILGEHNGCIQFTVGQRKGIGLAASHPLYVIKTDISTNTVFLGEKECLYSNRLKLNNFNWCYPQPSLELNAMVKIRYNMQPLDAVIKIQSGGVNIEFKEPIAAIASGQACVAYDKSDGHLLGGTYISFS